MRRWALLAIKLVLVCAAIGAIDLGVRIRREAWTFSQGAHFRGDIGNAFHWGRLAQAHGLFHLYQDDEAANPPGIGIPRFLIRAMPFDLPGRKTDYTPLRLTIAQAWYNWAHREFPEATAWEDSYEFTWPLLWSNTIAEGVAAALVFLIIMAWRKRVAAPDEQQGMKRIIAAMFGAMLLWFNPAVIWDGHCWPQWDIWPVPFFLAAVLLATVDWWMMAGVCLALGASLKGQMLLAGPVLLMWPIFRGHFGNALRLIAGFMLATSLIVLPWMLPSTPAIRWLVLMTGAMVFLSILPINWKSNRRWIGIALMGLSTLMVWPWGHSGGQAAFGVLALLMAAACVCIRFLPRRFCWPTIAILIAVSVFLLMPLYGASSAWYRLGFKYGTEKFEDMVTGSGAYNLPRMLEVYERWPESTTDPVTIPGTAITITFTQLTRIVYGIALVMCGIGAAMHDRRRDLRFLVAMVAPWLLFFVILTQMHGRYTIWAAAISALLAGADAGLALLGLILSIVSLAGIVENQLLFVPRWSPETLDQLRSLDPALGFVLILIAAIFLYLAATPGALRCRKPRKIDPLPESEPIAPRASLLI